jgi:amidase
MEGQETVSSVIGPMGHSISDLRFILMNILATQPWLEDPKVIKLPWRAEEEQDIQARAESTGLTFGVMRWNGIVKPHPPVQRGVEETVAKLRAQGHEVCTALCAKATRSER